MCRINGPSLLIKINKDTTKGDIDDIFAIAPDIYVMSIVSD